MKFKRLVTILSVIVVLGISAAAYVPSAHAAPAPVLKPQSESGDVWDLQYRLHALGYYNLPLDGKYGPATEAAVRKFQQNYGLAVDGVTGEETWSALKKFSLNQEEMDILAKLIHAEARGEPFIGQVAVGAVVMNRLQSVTFPDTLRGVVFEPWAFTAVHDGQFWLTPNETAYQAAFEAVRGWDPTYESLYYFNPDVATNKWIWTRTQTVKIGKHIFAR